jgi:hypothetical protein
MAAAPENATLLIQPGLYLEPPLTIEKSLTLKGAAADAFWRPLIRTIEPGPLLTVRPADRPVSVTLEGLELQALMIKTGFPTDSLSVGLRVEGVQDGPADQVKVVLRESRLYAADGGAMISGKASLSIQKTSIRVIGVALLAREGSQLLVEDSTILGDSWLGVVILLNVDALFRHNTIGYSALRVAGTRDSLFGVLGGGGRYTFVNNEISHLGMGLSFAGKTTLEFSENTVTKNKLYGIALNLPACFGSGVDSEQEFRGTITGQNNIITDNAKGDLCPGLKDYPWPPGFVKP